jgi:hypothetical protein
MRDIKLYLSAVTLAVLAGLPLAGQQASQQPPAANPPQATASQAEPGQGALSREPEGAARAVPVQSTANSPEVSNDELRPLLGELETRLDSRSAKAGDAVVVRTTEQTVTAKGVVIPKGAEILGQVVDVQASSDGNSNSKVTIAFEHAQLKPGQRLAIKTVLQSVAPSAAAEAGSSSAAAAEPKPVALSSEGAPAGSSPIGGSAVVSSVDRSSTAPAHRTPGTNATAGNTKPAVGTVVARQGNLAIVTTAIPGVLLATDADGQPSSNAAGAIVGARQNVHLDSGTQIVLAVSDAGTKGTNTR